MKHEPGGAAGREKAGGPPRRGTGLVTLWYVLGLPLSRAGAENPACGLQAPAASQKRVCQNATLTELEHKLSGVEQKLNSGGGIPALNAGNLWRTQVLTAAAATPARSRPTANV